MDPFAIKFPEGIYTQQEQEYIMAINLRRKILQSEENHNGMLSKKKKKELDALIWVLRLIEDIVLE